MSFRPGQVSWSFSLILSMFTFFFLFTLIFSLCYISNSVSVKQRTTFRHVTTFRNITQRMRQRLLAHTPKYYRKQTWTYCPVSEQGSFCCHSLMMCTSEPYSKYRYCRLCLDPTVDRTLRLSHSSPGYTAKTVLHCEK